PLAPSFYEMATGNRAFEGKSQASVIAVIRATEPTPVSNVQPDLPSAVDHVVATSLAKDPESRWQTARDLLLESTLDCGRRRRKTIWRYRRAAIVGSTLRWHFYCLQRWQSQSNISARSRQRCMPFDRSSRRPKARAYFYGVGKRRTCDWFARRAAPGFRGCQGRQEPCLGAPPGRARGPTTSRHRGRGGALLVARQPLSRIFRRRKAQETRGHGRDCPVSLHRIFLLPCLASAKSEGSTTDLRRAHLTDGLRDCGRVLLDRGAGLRLDSSWQ